jgi:hypothetical protein
MIIYFKITIKEDSAYSYHKEMVNSWGVGMLIKLDWSSHHMYICWNTTLCSIDVYSYLSTKNKIKLKT